MTRFTLKTAGAVCALWLVHSFDLSAQGEFRFSRTNLMIPERGAVEARLLMAGNNVFTFVPPAGWTESVDAQNQEIRFASRELRSVFNVKFVSPAKSSTALKRDDLLDQLRERFPGSLITEEFPCYTEAGRGFGFNLIQSEAGMKKGIRFAIVPIKDKQIEFTLISTPEFLPKCDGSWRALINSFALDHSPSVR